MLKLKNNAKTENDCATNVFDCRSKNSTSNTTVIKRKRDIMETSTPISTRREPKLMDTSDDSPVALNTGNISTETVDITDEVIQDTRSKAGISNEIDSMAMTPTKELSPNTMDLKLALHCVDIVRSSVGNPLVPELSENHDHTPDISVNKFAEKDQVSANKESVVALTQNARDDGVNEMNKSPPGGRNQAVGMDGMNKKPLRGGIRSVGMDGMNKTPSGGVGEHKVANDESEHSGARLKRTPRRKLNLNGEGSKCPSLSRFVLGGGVKMELMTSRACPDANSPKRQTPMEVDTPTPPKRKRRITKNVMIPPNQQRLTDVWKWSSGDAEEKTAEEKHALDK